MNLAKTKIETDKPKKFAIGKEPLQTVNVGNISSITNGCSNNQFRMLEDNIQINNSIYNFCTDDNSVSTSMNNSNLNKINDRKLSESTSYTPIPIQINNNNILN